MFIWAQAKAFIVFPKTKAAGYLLWSWFKNLHETSEHRASAPSQATKDFSYMHPLLVCKGFSVVVIAYAGINYFAELRQGPELGLTSTFIASVTNSLTASYSFLAWAAAKVVGQYCFQHYHYVWSQEGSYCSFTFCRLFESKLSKNLIYYITIPWYLIRIIFN